jgi:hypothetical protein
LQFFKAAGDQHSDILSGKRFVHMYSSHSWAVHCQAAGPREKSSFELKRNNGRIVAVRKSVEIECEDGAATVWRLMT